MTTYNVEAGRSWFHGIPAAVLQRVAEVIGIPLESVPVGQFGADDAYSRDFEVALGALQEKYDAQAVVYGDIDIQAHHDWDVARAAANGMEAVFPLWNEERRKLVFEMIDAGFKAVITIVNTEVLSERLLGKTLTRALAEEMASVGVDMCGENGEYHSFVYDGPLFREAVKVKFGEQISSGSYAILPVLLDDGVS
jgi:uncharacterized protein (TIGR00290 family)